MGIHSNFALPRQTHEVSVILKFWLSLALGSTLLLASCGGDGQSPTYAVSGTVSGLTTNGLLLANGDDIVNVAPNAQSFTFPKQLAPGQSYSITVHEQPSERDQVCVATANSGIVSHADVSNVSVNCHATSWVVSTVAGSGTTGSMDDIGIAASFNSPWGIAVDSFGNLYVADRGNNRIRKVAPTGVVTTLAGSGALGFTDGQGAAASFNVPQGVAVDAAGNILIADSTNCAIRKISSAGLVSSLAGTPATCGRITSIDGTGNQASFNNPTALTATTDGTIFVADTYNHIVRQVSPTSVVTSLPTTATALPDLRGIAADSAGNLYYPDSNSQRVFRVATNGTVTVLAGSGATGSVDGQSNSATFTSPYGIAVDRQGNVYVSEASRIIRKISRSGRVVTIAGTPFVGGATDGSGPAALFELPAGLAVDRAGNIYVADNLNNNIRKIEAR